MSYRLAAGTKDWKDRPIYIFNVTYTDSVGATLPGQIGAATKAEAILSAADTACRFGFTQFDVED